MSTATAVPIHKTTGPQVQNPSGRGWTANNNIGVDKHHRRSIMSRVVLLDPAKKGREAEELEKQLHHLIVGQDEAIHQVVRAYQTHLAGLSPVGRPIGN